MDLQSLRTEWEPKLRFLKWSDNPGGGVVLGRDTETGREGYRCKDGSWVGYNDPRVADYHRSAWQVIATVFRGRQDEIYKAVADADPTNRHPFSQEYARLRPKFIQWLNDGAPLNEDGSPAAEITIAEFKIFYAAFEEWRMIRGRAGGGIVANIQNANGEPKADKIRTRKKNSPRSPRVWRAITAVNDHYKRVADGKTQQLSREAIIAENLGVSQDDRDAKNLARQIRNYEHLIKSTGG